MNLRKRFLQSEFYNLLFGGLWDGCKNIATTVSIEIERVAQGQFCVCSVYARLR